MHLPGRLRPCCALLLPGALALAACGPDPADYSPFEDLIRKLPVAEVHRETGLLDLGTPEARRHLLRGWSVDEGSGGETYVWSDGPESELSFFLAKARDLPLSLRCLPYRFAGAPVQELTLVVNGEEVATLPLDSPSEEYRLELPESALAAGGNRLVFRYGYTRSPSVAAAGTSHDGRRLAVRWDSLRFGRAGEEAEVRATKEQLYLPFGTRVDVYTRLPERSALLLDRLTARGEPAGELLVSVQPAGGDAVREVRAAMTERPAAVALGGGGDGGGWRTVRLSLTAIPESWDDAGGASGLVLSRPALGARGAPAAPGGAAAGAAGAAKPSRRLPNVLIYLVDTLRVDHLGCYGYPKPVSPHLDAFAREAVLFERAVAQSPWTRPSVASIFTGVWPKTHGVNRRRDSLAPEALTLPEMLRSRGYRTAAFITNGNVAKNFGFGQGFDEFEFLQGRKQDSEVVTALAEAWLDGHPGDRPFFLYLHTADPHASYAPPQRFRERFAADVPLDGTGTRSWLRRLESGKIPVTPDLVEDLRALYDAEVAANDESFGALLAALKRRGLWDETVVLFLSDHGEEFFEHGQWEHGRNLYTEVLDVPWVARFPGLPAGLRVAETVQHVDLVPTLLSYLGLPLPPALEGRDLLPLLDREPAAGPGEPQRAIFSYLDLDGVVGAAVTTADWRLIDARVPRAGTELYDRRQDRAEQQDRAADRRIDTGYLRALLEEKELARAGRLEPGQAVLDEELRRQLKALGYLD